MKPIIKVPLKFGLFGTLMVIIMFFVFYLADSNPLIEMRTFDFFILPIFLFFGIKEFRDAYNKKLLEFWEGMTSGFIIYFGIALFTSLFLLLFMTLDGGVILQGYIDHSLQGFESAKEQTIAEMGSETYTNNVENIRSTTTLTIFYDNLLRKMAVGLLLTIMIAVIMRKKEEKNQ